MKRIIPFIIVFAMIINFNSFIKINAEDDGYYEPYETSATLLEALGVIEKNVDFSSNLTRGQAAKYVAEMLNEEESLLEYRGIFSDVLSENENALYIEKLCDLGIVKGDGNYNYRPEVNMSYNEAMWILVKALGYGARDDIASSVYQIANTEGIFNNTKQEFSVINKGDFFVMMYNTLMAKPFMRDKIGSDKLSYYISDSDLIYHIYKIVHDKGIIVKNDITYLWSSQSEDNDLIEVQLSGGERLRLYSDDIISLRDDLGKSATVFYKFDDDLNENLYVCHILSNNKTMKLDISDIDADITDFNDYTVAYTKDDSSSAAVKLKLSADYNIIYNNVAYKSDKFDFKSCSDKQGYVELIDANRDNLYETVKIKIYDSVIADRRSQTYNYITDKFNADIKINIDENEYSSIFVYDKEEKEISISDIVPGNTLSVAKSDCGIAENDVIEIYVSDNIANGKLTEFIHYEDPRSITLDGMNTYRLFDRAAQGSYIENKNIICYIDVFGGVVYIKSDSEFDVNYGLITRLKLSENTPDKEVKLKYINGSGEVIDAKLKENIIIDGKSYKNKISDAVKKLNSATASSTDDVTIANGVIPMRYKADENGDLAMIDTMNDDMNTSEDVFSSNGTGRFGVYCQYIFGWDIPFSSDATVLEIYANDFNDLSEYENTGHINISVASKTFRTGNINCNVLTYKSDKESIYSDFIIRLVTGEYEYGTSFFILDSISEAYNAEESTTMTLVKGYLKDVYTELYLSRDAACHDNLVKLKKGDVIRFITNRENQIIDFQPVLVENADNTKNFSIIMGHGFGKTSPSSATVVFGAVYLKEGSVIRLNQFPFGKVDPDIKSIDWSTAAMKFAGLPETVSYIVVTKDKETGRVTVEKGTEEAIKDYKTFKNDCSTILMRYRSGTLQEAIIYNK